MVPRVGHRLREPGWSAHFAGGVFDGKLLEYSFMRITEAARRLGTSARMLRYREDLGLLPRVRERPAGSRRGAAVSGRGAVSGHGAVSRRGAVSGPGAALSGRGAAHRVFTEEDLEAVAAALELERRYDISPAALAFGVRVLAEPAVRAVVADLGRRLGRIPAPASRALDFEKERALRLLQGR